MKFCFGIPGRKEKSKKDNGLKHLKFTKNMTPYFDIKDVLNATRKEDIDAMKVFFERNQ